MRGREKQKINEVQKKSGLDMDETINWYKIAGINIPPIVEKDFPYPIENKNLIGLSESELGGLLSLFPENSRKRSILRKVVGQPSAWFHKDSTKEKPQPTRNQAEALSPTAIIPSYIDYAPWNELKTPAADIWLYEIPKNAASDEIGRIIAAEGFIHEVGHSIIQPAISEEDYNLKFPDGTIINGFEAIMHFAELAEQHDPISHYASTYRGPNNKFEGDNAITAISEEMCETIAAHLLGFAYRNNDQKGNDPFADRLEIKDYIKKFLNAERISYESSQK